MLIDIFISNQYAQMIADSNPKEREVDMTNPNLPKWIKEINVMFLENLINNSQSLTLKKIKQLHEEKYPEKRKYSISTYRLVLKKFLKKTWRKGKPIKSIIKSTECIEEKFLFLKYFLKLLEKEFTIIYIDESCFTSYMDHSYRWLGKEAEFFVDLDPNIKIRNHQLILASTFDKIIHHKVFPGINNQFTFTAFLQELKSKIEEKFPSESKIIFYLDGPFVHDNERVYNFFKDNNLKLIYGVRYYSKLDFCEYLFQIIKKKHYSNVYTTEADLESFIDNSAKDLRDKKSLENLKRHYFKLIKEEMNFYSMLKEDLRFVKMIKT